MRVTSKIPFIEKAYAEAPASLDESLSRFMIISSAFLDIQGSLGGNPILLTGKLFIHRRKIRQLYRAGKRFNKICYQSFESNGNMESLERDLGNDVVGLMSLRVLVSDPSWTPLLSQAFVSCDENFRQYCSEAKKALDCYSKHEERSAPSLPPELESPVES